eukprot:Partr_v1_DN25143_c0_g1_i1_m76557 putative Guanine nucleotide binding protein (G protein) alpha
MFSCCTGGSSGKKAQNGDESTPASAKVSQVDKELELAGHQDKLKFKILLLGSGESGKSTVLKQLKLIHRINISPQETKEIASSLKRNSVECMAVLIEQAQQFGYDFESDEQRAKAEILKKVDPSSSDEITDSVADSIKTLWKSECIVKTFERKNEYWILDAAEYYFQNIDRFVQDDYEPSEEDVVMVCFTCCG